MARIFKDRAVILQVSNWREADKKVVCLTEENGKVVFFAYGARYARNVAGRLLQPFAELNIELYQGDRMDKLKSCEAASSYPQFELMELAYASLAAEVTEILTEQGNPQPELYELFIAMLQLIKRKNPRIAVLSYLIKLLDMVGIGPVYEVCVNCAVNVSEDAVFSCAHGGMLCRECMHGGGGRNFSLTGASRREAVSAGKKTAEVSANQSKKSILPLSVETRELWRHLRLMDFEEEQAFTVKGGALMELERIIHSYVLWQSGLDGRELNSIKFISQVSVQR